MPTWIFVHNDEDEELLEILNNIDGYFYHDFIRGKS